MTMVDRATVIRQGQENVIENNDVCIGDLVMLKQGDTCPADIILLQSENLVINNYLLTHEEEHNHVSATKNPNASYFTAENVLYYGTIIISGKGQGIAVNIGSNTLKDSYTGVDIWIKF